MKTSNADTWFSRYIRLRDAMESNGVLVVKCCTCGAIREAKRVDCGHYVKRQHKATRWHENNCLSQCKRCNSFEQGEPETMAKEIDRRFGQGTAEHLKEISRQITKSNETLIADHYREKVLQLLEQRGWKHLKWW